MKGGDPVGDGIATWRLPESRAKFFTKKQRQPTLEAFRPRPGEKRVSVWDGTDNSRVDRVIELRGKPPGEVAIVAIDTDHVRAVGAGLGRSDVCVVGDPEGAPRGATEGERELHYGIEGLADHQAPDSEQHTALLSRLARACRPVFPPA